VLSFFYTKNKVKNSNELIPISQKQLFFHLKKLKIKACSSVDRASDSDSESQGFDSLHAYGLIFKFAYGFLGLLWFRHLRVSNV
jgi:hypothetical protein